MNHILERFKLYLELEVVYRPRTIHGYLSALGRFYAVSDPLELARYADIAEIIILIGKERRWSSPTRSKFASILSEFYRWAEREALIQHNPFKSHTFKKGPTKLPEFFSEEELVRIYTNPNLTFRDSVMIRILGDTGIRRNELISLKKADINIEERTLFVRDGKGGRSRTVYFTQRTADFLRLYVDLIADVLFPTKDGRPLNESGLNKYFARLSERLGIKIYPHKFRHSIAGRIVSKTGNLQLAKEILGHANLNTTSIYTHLPKANIKRNYDEIMA